MDNNQQVVVSSPLTYTSLLTSKDSFGRNILKILLVIFLFGLLPIILKILDRFLFVSFIPLFYLLSRIIIFCTFFSLTLIISKKLGNIHPLFVLLISFISGSLIFLGNVFFCSIAMLIPCEQTSLFSPLAILFTIDVNSVVLLGYSFALLFIWNRKNNSFNLKIPSLFLIILITISLVVLFTPDIHSYITRQAIKNISGYQKISDSQPVKQEVNTQKQNKIPFKQSLELALAKARKYDSEVKTSSIRLAQLGEADVYIQSGFTKIVPIPGKDVVISESSDKNNVTIVIDGDSGVIKDSYKFTYSMGEKGIDDFSDFIYGPDEAVNLIKTTEKYKKFKEKAPKDNGLVVWFKPTEKPYYWEIWTNAKTNNDFYEVRFFVSTKDLSIKKAILNLGKNQETPINNNKLPVDIESNGGLTFYDKNLNFTIKYPTSLIFSDDGFQDKSNKLRCGFIDHLGTELKILKETVIKEQNPKIVKLKVIPASNSTNSVLNMPYINQEALYLITQEGFPQIELRCYTFQEDYRYIIEQMLLTLEFTDK